MSVFDIFRPAKPQGQAQPQQPVGNTHVENNPTVPTANNTPPAPQPPEQSPTENFKDLWTMPSNQTGNKTPNFQLNPEQLQSTASKIDFTRSIKQEDLQAIANGGEGAVTALMNVLNNFGQQVFSTNAQFSSHLTEAGYRAASDSINTGLPSLVKKQFSQAELFNTNPKLRTPELQPLVLAIQSQITERHPNASTQEVNAMVDKYFTEVIGKAFTKEDSQQSQPAGADTFDFSSFLR